MIFNYPDRVDIAREKIRLMLLTLIFGK